MLLWVLRRRWHGADENSIARTVMQATVASLVMGAAILGVEMLWRVLGFTGRSAIWTVAQIGVETLVGVIVFVMVAALLRMQELTFLRNLVLRRGSRITAATTS